MGETAKRKSLKAKYNYIETVLLDFCDVYKETRRPNVELWRNLWGPMGMHGSEWTVNKEANLFKDITEGGKQLGP